MKLAAPQPPAVDVARRQIRAWLEAFAAAVRAVDYDAGRAMFADDVVGFGTFAKMLVGREELVAGQWKNIWGVTRGFTFALDQLHCESSGQIAWIAVPWHSQGRDPAGNWYDRFGRCTLVLRRDGSAGDRWLCCHSHFSRVPDPKPGAV
jgi:ketosteroid isomerase-like protein